MAVKQLPLYYYQTKAPNVNDFLILDFSIIDICNFKSKLMTKNKDSPTTTINAVIQKQNGSGIN